MGATRVLQLTPPAVSQQVAALESALGNPLFQRTPRRMVPTEAGQILYTQIPGAIEKLASLPTKTQQPKLRKPLESVRRKNFLLNEFSIDYRRTIVLFKPYNLG
ncbi:LysR family transcriptional regulator [Microcoleus sp. F4-D5]|uniref:LysR family transcriptional regulator n=1 Tax=Microcoleus sp. F4-D5 TaxID=2818760 RepID=UPI002FD0EC81